VTDRLAVCLQNAIAEKVNDLSQPYIDELATVIYRLYQPYLEQYSQLEGRYLAKQLDLIQMVNFISAFAWSVYL